jgi:hypothetical protein
LQGFALAINDGDDDPLKLSAEMLTTLQRARSPRGPLYAALSGASPQVQGGEALGEVSDGWCGHARAVNWSNRQGPPPGTKLYASPQRAPGVAEGCAIQLSADDWNPYELLDVVRHSLAASTPAVIVERIDECLRQQKQTQRAALASGPSVDAMVNRFLAWPLPKDFAPDCGISFDGRKDDEWNKGKTWPIGTNLLTAVQAKAMFQHCLASGPSGVDEVDRIGAIIFRDWNTNERTEGGPTEFYRGQIRQFIDSLVWAAPAAQDQGEGNG